MTPIDVLFTSRAPSVKPRLTRINKPNTSFTITLCRHPRNKHSRVHVCGGWTAAQSATGEAARRETASGAGVSLLVLVLQEVGRLVARHPPHIHRLEGRVPTGVVHTAEGRVPAGGRRRLRPRSLHLGGDVVNNGDKEVSTVWMYSPFIVENTVGNVQRPQEGPDVVIRPVLSRVAGHPLLWFVMDSWLVQMRIPLRRTDVMKGNFN